MPGTIYLLPMLLGDSGPELAIPDGVQKTITSLRIFFAENIKTTRRYLRKLDKTFDIDGSDFHVLNKKTTIPELTHMLEIVKSGSDAGIISEAGLPGVGDPGSKLVAMAHNQHIKIRPLTGPSSFVLALVASGLNGQSFAFHGYLPVKKAELHNRIKVLEKQSAQNNQTQIFMETPYRNQQLIGEILNTCHKNTRLCIAVNITLEDEAIHTRTIGEWKNATFDFHKKPAVFALLKDN